MSRNNKSPDEQAQMRTDGLSAHDWAVMTEYMNAPRITSVLTSAQRGLRLTTTTTSPMIPRSTTPLHYSTRTTRLTASKRGLINLTGSTPTTARFVPCGLD